MDAGISPGHLAKRTHPLAVQINPGIPTAEQSIPSRSTPGLSSGKPERVVISLLTQSVSVLHSESLQKLLQLAQSSLLSLNSIPSPGYLPCGTSHEIIWQRREGCASSRWILKPCLRELPCASPSRDCLREGKPGFFILQ